MLGLGRDRWGVSQKHIMIRTFLSSGDIEPRFNSSDLLLTSLLRVAIMIIIMKKANGP